MNYFGTYQGYNPIQQTNQNFQQPIQQVQQPIQSQPITTPSQPFSNGGMFFFVSSKEEAEKWVVSQGQIVYLFNVNDGVFYVKSVGKNGLPQPLETYTFEKQEMIKEENKEEPKIEYVSKEEFLDFSENIKNEINKLKPISTTRKREVKKDE